MLARELNPEDVRGQIIISPVVNPPAAYGSRDPKSPLDGVNMNRVFPGNLTGKPTERLAAWLFDNIIAGADAFADLHSSGIDETLLDYVGYRRTSNDELNNKTYAMARAVGYERVVCGMNPDGGNSHAAAIRNHIPSILIETGQLGERGPAKVKYLLDSLYRLLKHLEVLLLPAEASLPATPPRDWVWVDAVESPATGLWYPDEGAGSSVVKGQIIGRVVEPGDGTVHVIAASGTGVIVYGMNGLTVQRGTELAYIGKPTSSESTSSNGH